MIETADAELHIEEWQLLGSDFLFSPTRQGILVLYSQAKARVVQTTQSGRKARETALGLMRGAGTNVTALTRDRTERLLRERGQTHSPGMLCTGNTEAASTGRGMVTVAGRAVAHTQVAIAGRLVLVQRAINASMGKVAVASAIV